MHCTVTEMVQNMYVIFYKSLQQLYYNTALNDSNNIKMELFEDFFLFCFGNTKVTLTKIKEVQLRPHHWQKQFY